MSPTHRQQFVFIDLDAVAMLKGGIALREQRAVDLWNPSGGNTFEKSSDVSATRWYRHRTTTWFGVQQVTITVSDG